MSFEAKYAGTCQACAERIRAGDRVMYVDVRARRLRGSRPGGTEDGDLHGVLAYQAMRMRGLVSIDRARLLAHLRAKADHPNLLIHAVLTGLATPIARGDFDEKET
jgi:hypothetical protein